MTMLRTALPLALSLTLSLTASAAQANGLERLQRFLDGTKTLRAEFNQTVLAKNGRKPQLSSGSMAIARPGKFRWQIEQPYAQLIVSDGNKVWLYDPELKQVTVRKLGQALGSSPAALLAGDGGAALNKNFTLRDDGEKNGLEWVEATPKSTDSGFERVLLGFAGDTLKSMTLADSFGQTTVLIFSHVERNPAIAASQFHFTPPSGADIVGE
jgi:outer membrane lipoprotein carrier protein